MTVATASSSLQAQPPDEDGEQKAGEITSQNFSDVMRQLNAPLSEDMTKRIVEVRK